jgi:hypothetical protein
MTALALKAEREAGDAAKRRAWESEHKIEPPAPPSTMVDKPKPANAAHQIEPSPAAPAAGARKRVEPKKESAP